MNNHESRQRICYRLLQITALFLACYFTLGNLAGIRTFSPWHLVCAGLSVLFLAGINYSKLKGRLLCLLALAGGFVLLCLITGPETFFSFWNSCLHRMTRDGLWDKNFTRGFELVQMVAMAFSCYLLQLILEHFPPLRRILVTVLLAALLCCMLSKYPVSHLGFVFCFWYLIITLLEEIQRKWEKTGKHHQKIYIVRIMPFCVVYLILLLLAPVSEKPYQWQWARDLYQQVRERVILCYEDILRGENEDFALSGFSGSGRLSGSLRDSHRQVLTLQGSRSLVTNVYLAGKVYGHFDGTTWQQNCTNSENERLLDALETLYAVSLYDDLPENYIAYTSLKIRYEHFSTAYLFAPLKSLKINDCEYISHRDCLLFEEQKGYGTTYDVYYPQLNLNEPAFYRMLETGQEPDESVWNELSKKYTPKNRAPVTSKELEAHRTHILENYTEKPCLSGELEEYLRQITQSAGTDLEKLLAIEAELSSYTYTENPGPLPDGVTDPGAFLDYFLLDSRQGYCCHFATAFVLLARAEGLPARYVEGFCVPMTAGKSTAVFSDMAHAWPEVYLEGVGWIPFEPTPGYEEVRYTPWQLKQKTAPSASSAEEPDALEEEISAPGELPSEPETSPAPFSRNWPTVFLCILLLCTAAAAFWGLEQIIRRRRYRRMEPTARLRIQVENNFWLLSKLGFLRADTETLSEFCRRVPKPCTFINCYEEILYGGRPVPEQIPEIIFSERKQLLALVKAKRKLLYPLIWLRLKAYEKP